jgi:hypothetical protein
MLEFKTIGADPEFVIRYKNKYLPSFMFIEGTKQNPEDKGNGFAVLKDNLLIEGNIPPSSTEDSFYSNMSYLITMINLLLETKKPGAHIDFVDIAKFDKRFIYTKDGQEFGCSSYIDAWEKCSKQSPKLGDSLYRPVGTHIHLGYDVLDDNVDPMIMNLYLARAYDYFVSLPSDIVSYTKQRRENYGAYGAFRPTPYGIEFRTLGGYFGNPAYTFWIYNQVQKVVEYCSSAENCEKLESLKKPSYEDYDFLGIDLVEQIPPSNGFSGSLRNTHVYRKLKSVNY